MNLARRFLVWVQRWPLTFAVIVLAVALLVLSVTFAIYAKQTGDETASLRSRLIKAESVAATAADESGCRSKIAARVSSAQTDNAVAFNTFVVHLADQLSAGAHPLNLNAETQRLADTGAALTAATAARNTFENQPTGDC